MLSEIKVRMYLWVSVCLYYPSKQKHPSDVYVPGKEEAKKGWIIYALWQYNDGKKGDTSIQFT